MEDNLIKELSREKLGRLSSDFEVELLRLIKTLNLITQSKELYKNQVEEIEAISNNLKIRINDFTIKLLEIEKSAREGVRESQNDFSSSQDAAPAHDYDTIIKEVTQFREIIDTVDKDIERAKTGHLNRLDSFYSVYNLELKASQGELDTKLTHLKELLAKAQPESPAEEPLPDRANGGPEQAYAQGNGSGEAHVLAVPPETRVPQAPPRASQETHTSEIPKRNINLAHDAPPCERAAAFGSGGLFMAIVFLFFGAIVGITTFYLLDIIGDDDTAPVLREEIYSENDITVREEYSSLSASNKEASPQSVREVITRKPTDESSSAQLNLEQIKDPEARKYLLDKTAAESASKEGLKEPLKTGANDTGKEYAASPKLTEPAVSGSDLYTVVGPGANVRSGPSMSYSVATVVLEGDMFVSTGENRGIWIKVLAPDGTEGWISKKLVKQIN
jgi:hypothetical protein